MNFSNLSPEAQWVLEWMNLALGAFCAAVGVFCGTTSPRPWPDSPMVNFLMAGTMVPGIPLLVLTTVMLLFSNRQRAVLGFILLVVAVVGLANTSLVMA